MAIGWNIVLTAAVVLGLLGEKKEPADLPDFPGTLEVRSSIPGRMRIGLSKVKEDPARVEEMRKTLLETGVFSEISVNPVTESVLFRYDPQKIEPLVLESVVIRLLNLEQAIETRPISAVQHGLLTLCRGIDNGVYDLTGGLVSGQTAAGIALFAAAVCKGSQQGLSLPGAATLLWWASGVLRRDVAQGC